MTDRKWRWFTGTILMAAMTLALAGPVSAGEENPDWVSKIVSLQGEVSVKRAGEGDWRPVLLNDFFFAGDAMRVAANSRAALVLSNETVLRVDQLTTLVFKGIQEPKSFWMELLEGAAFFFSRKPRSLTVSTPFVNGVVEGTEFYVRVDRDQTTVMLFEGAVRAENANGALLLAKGQTVVAEAGQAPRLTTVVRPRDAVQWALYYTPSLVFQPDDFPVSGAADWRVNARRSVQALAEGRLADAFAAVQSIDPSTADNRFSVYRAHLRLTVGQVGGAREDIERALAQAPRDSDALALRAVIAVVQNRREEALADARAAVETGPRSAAAHLALSYAWQARFDLPAAAAAAEAATAAEPENPLAWARLGEMRLCLGDLDAALSAARKSVALPPPLAHTQNVLGYAYLSQIKTAQAQAAFQEAIALDSAAPLPRLGLGLAQIREGRLAEGRAEIEIAAALDPDNALIRSYLGKAYFDEKRGDLDERQLEMAKRLDPNDPTPWFYDAIRKQTLNRPGEALQDMQQAVELNDNRAVYRSRLMLDDDLAARSAALGRIYSDLSFPELAIDQGEQSLEADPANYSAHRLLADMYASRPRHEIARVSELLQSQLLQPLNLSPVQPQLAESNLPILEGAGPSEAGFNEFNPLFARNRVAFQASGVVGENDTLGDDLTLSGLHQWLSFSVGQFHYETEGFRPNNDMDQDIYDVFAQAALSARTSLQIEYRQKKTENGDYRMRFDPDNYSAALREEREEQSPRMGFHHAFNPRNHLIASLIYSQLDAERNDQGTIEGTPILLIENSTEEYDAYNAELQYLYLRPSTNVTVGAGYYDQDSDETYNATGTIDSVPIFEETFDSESEARHANGYFYWNVKPFTAFNATLGLSGDKFDKGEVEAEQLNPKLGLTWNPYAALTLRAAAFRAFKRSLVSNQTIEPTNVAGFNQFFDDPIATDSTNYGMGATYQVTKNFAVGGEVYFRDLEVPVLNIATQSIREEDQEEQLHRCFAYWLPWPSVALSAEYIWEDLDIDLPPDTLDQPKALRTQTLPITLAYYDKTGWYAMARVRIVHQSLEQYVAGVAAPQTEDEDFTVVDTGLGYRLPKRYGIVSLVVTNLFDQSFSYYDPSFQTGIPKTPAFIPERQILLRATLSF